MDMKSISQKLQDDIRAIMEGKTPVDEALVGKQRNIDTNHNGKIDAEDFVKLRAMKKTPSGKVHNCATHVEHAVLGKGVTVSEEHAEPDAEGNIEWYTVQFEGSTQKVLTKDLTITMSESHEHKSKKYKMEEVQLDEKDEGKPGLMFKKIAAKAAARYGSVEAGNRVAGAIRKKVLAKEGVEVTEKEIDDMFEAYVLEAANRAQQAAIAISLIKAGKKDGKMPKPMKEEDEQFEYSFADYLNVARAKYGEENAVLIANEAFKNRDIALFDADSQSPEA
jgi:hypothetical protein